MIAHVCSCDVHRGCYFRSLLSIGTRSSIAQLASQARSMRTLMYATRKHAVTVNMKPCHLPVHPLEVLSHGLRYDAGFTVPVLMS